MSTILNTNGENLHIPEPAYAGFTFHVVTASWNPEITHSLRDGAVETLLKAGILKENITLHSVPGTVELVNAAATVIDCFHPSGVIIIGCVVRGDTPHFDYVCLQASQGTAILNSRGDTPVTFGVLTVDNIQQARDRSGGVLGNKGSEAACAALDMANLQFTCRGAS